MIGNYLHPYSTVYDWKECETFCYCQIMILCKTLCFCQTHKAFCHYLGTTLCKVLSCHLVTIEYVSCAAIRTYYISSYKFSATTKSYVFHVVVKSYIFCVATLWATSFMLLLFKLWVLCCCISNYKFCIGPFQAIGFAFCVSLLHFELGITILLLFVLHMSCVTIIPKKFWNQSVKFSFLFHHFD
jgi:hypothetical protein